MRIPSLALFFYSGLCFAASYPVLTYSTYLRDSFSPNAIATDSSGNIYMAGNAIVDPTSFPSTSQTAVLVVKLNPQATQYLYVRYLGGSVDDYANAIAVDSAGNAFIAGATASPDFPVTTGVSSGAPASQSNQRSFVTKLDPNGELVFSEVLGAPAASSAQAVAVSSSGQIAVTGMVSNAAGPSFPSTAGAYSIVTTANHPYLIELDPTGTKTIFSATGIGGSALAFDSSGNIYVAGTTFLFDYPTTSGAYQTTFPTVNCPACLSPMQGANQYVTKVDPTGAKLLYSTAVTGTNNTTNAGLAVDTAGNAYLTGYAGAGYPYTVTSIPSYPGSVPFTIPALPFLSKLDPLGHTLLFSIPIGGAGVQLDAGGNIYVGGSVGRGVGGPVANYIVTGNLPTLANIPAPCLPNAIIQSPAYVAQVDTSGGILGSQFIGGSKILLSGIALSGSTLWIAGATRDFNVPFTPNTLTLPSLDSTPIAGAYLGGVDFSKPQPPAGTPQIACIVDSADFAAIGPAAPYQLLTIFGTGLGPFAGVAAANNSTLLLGGVTVSSGAVSSPLLYVSSTQINFAVPLVQGPLTNRLIQVTVNGVNALQREIPFTLANPSLFLNSTGNILALNADGSLNSAANPARFGSAMSVFVNGLAPTADVAIAPPLFSTDFGWTVTGVAQPSPFVLRVDLRTPTQMENNFSCTFSFAGSSVSVCLVGIALFDTFYSNPGPQSGATSGLALGGTVFINPPLN